jgi:hypothetical protein
LRDAVAGEKKIPAWMRLLFQRLHRSRGDLAGEIYCGARSACANARCRLRLVFINA